jgi:hypothetical protein
MRPSVPSMVPWFAILLVGAVLACAVPAQARDHKDKHADEADRGKPRLRLVAKPAVGFIPLTVELTATMSGVAPDDANFCHPAVTWLRVDPGQTEDNASRYHEDSACRHPPEESAAMTAFTRSVDLYRPGSYLFRLIVEGKDGTRAVSAYVRVEALRVD